MKQQEELSLMLGKEKAEKVLKLQKNCDKYLLKFKKEMNSLLKSQNLEVLCGVAFKEISKQ